MRYLPIECERTRQWVSAALDDELSQLERAHVAAHVACCPGCSRFEAQAASIAAAIRSAPLEQLRSTVQLPRTVRPGRRALSAWSAPLRLARVSSAAAVMATAVLVGVLALPQRDSLARKQLAATPVGQTDETNALVVQVRRPALASGEQHALAFGTGGIGAYKPPLAPVA